MGQSDGYNRLPSLPDRLLRSWACAHRYRGVVFLFAWVALVLGAPTLARAQQNLGPPDLDTMLQLQNDYGWGSVFGWPAGTNPCPRVGANWAGVACSNGRIDSIVADCGPLKLNQPLPPILAQLTAMRDFNLRGCGMVGPANTINWDSRLTRLRLDNNTLTGSMPVLASLPNIQTLNMTSNSLGGTLRPYPNTCSVVSRLSRNRLSGYLPPEWIEFNRDLSGNMFEGLAPDSVSHNSCPNAPLGSNVVAAYSKFDVASPTLTVGDKQTQTVPPTNVQITGVTANGATLQWTPILYQTNGGYYEVLGSPVAGGPYVPLGRTTDKMASGITLSGLASGATYFLVVRTFTPAHANNPNDLTSRPSAEVSATTAVGAPVVVTHTRDDSSPGSLRWAVTNVAPGGTITFSNSTTDCAVNFYDGTAHLITLNGTPIAIDKSLAIIGPGERLLYLGGGGQSRIFTVGASNPAVDVTLMDLTITGGRSNGVAGGGVRSESANSLTLTRCTVTGNEATGAAGGGVANVGSGTLHLIRSTLATNHATGGTASGGGLYTSGAGAVHMVASTFELNTAGADGGAVAQAGAGALTIEACTLASNSAGGSGGGVAHLGGSTFSLVNSTLSGNTANGNGGAVSVFTSAPVFMTNDTLTGNHATDGGGLFLTAGTAFIGNTIIASNSASGAGPEVSGPVVSDGFNVLGQQSGVALLDITDTEVADPLLGPLRFNGGPTRTMAPLPGSPALNAGDSGIAMAANLLVDQRGLPRFVSVFSYSGGFNRGSTDAGAYQSSGLSPGEWTVNQPYTGTIYLEGGVPPLVRKSSSATLAAPATNVPPGLSANAAGSTVVFNGAPSAANNYPNIGVSANFASDTPANAPFRNVPGTFTLKVYPTGLTITTTTLPDGVAGAPYTAALAVSGGNGNNTYTLASGTLPPGVKLNPDGTFSGIATALGDFSFAVQVVNGLPTGTVTKSLRIHIGSTSPGSDRCGGPPDPCLTAVPTQGCTVNGKPNQPCQGGGADDTIIGTSGNDVIRGGAGNDTLKGNAGDDVLCGEDSDDIVLGGVGNDSLNGGSGSDVLKGEAGDDTLFGGTEDDSLIGGTGLDYLDGSSGNDKLLGNEDNDLLLGDVGDDILNGGDGDDMLNGESGTDDLTGGPGRDTCRDGEKTTTCE